MAKNSMTICKVCGAEIAKSAKVCPNCGAKNKKPIYKRVWFIILVVLVVLGIIGSAIGGGSDTPADNAAQTAEQDVQGNNDSKDSEAKVEYQDVSADQMMSDLEANAAAAKDTYEGQYVAVSGKLGTIDSDGQYIDVLPNDEFAILGVTCYIQNDEQLDKVKEMSTDDPIVVKGQITDVGEVLGYSLQIDKIEK